MCARLWNCGIYEFRYDYVDLELIQVIGDVWARQLSFLCNS